MGCRIGAWCKKQGNKVQCVKVRFGRIDPTTITVLHLQIGFFICKFRTVSCRIYVEVGISRQNRGQWNVIINIRSRAAGN